MTDNVGVVYVLNNNFSKTATIRTMLIELNKLLCSVNSTVSATYIPGKDNVVSDFLSRVDIGDAF